MERSRTNKNALNGEAWRAFLDDHLVLDEDGRKFFAGVPVTDKTQDRALYRWREEKTLAGFWAADRFLSMHGMHIDEFIESWCPQHGCSPWELGEEPGWHRLPDKK